MEASVMKADPGPCAICRKGYAEHLPSGRCPGQSDSYYEPARLGADDSGGYVQLELRVASILSSLRKELPAQCAACGNVVHVDNNWGVDPRQYNLCSMCRERGLVTWLVMEPTPHLEVRTMDPSAVDKPVDDVENRKQVERDAELLQAQALIAVLIEHAGETGANEDAVDVAKRLSAYWRAGHDDSALVQAAQAAALAALQAAERHLRLEQDKAMLPGEGVARDKAPSAYRVDAALTAVRVAECCDRLVDKLTLRRRTP
jgi:hypothetical protein